MNTEQPTPPPVVLSTAQLGEIADALGMDTDAPTTQEILAAIKRLKAAVNELTHQVICCGVAATHPDAELTKKGAYAGKWNSAQAEEVRKLRADRDRLRATPLMRKTTRDEKIVNPGVYEVPALPLQLRGVHRSGQARQP